MTDDNNLLRDVVRKCSTKLSVVIFFSLFINLLMFVAPIHMLQIYDRVLISRSEITLVVLTGLAVGLLVIYGLLEGVRSRILVRVGLQFDELMSNKVFNMVFDHLIDIHGFMGYFDIPFGMDGEVIIHTLNGNDVTAQVIQIGLDSDPKHVSVAFLHRCGWYSRQMGTRSFWFDSENYIFNVRRGENIFSAGLYNSKTISFNKGVYAVSSDLRYYVLLDYKVF